MDEAELLFSEVLGCDRAALYLDKDRFLDQDKLAFISSVLKRRIKGEPIQYILGEAEFMGLKLKVNPDVLIPRPETEILVETALKFARRSASPPARRLRLLDLGTGSGCIAISLSKYPADLEIDASDISARALEIAQENSRLNSARINFIQSDLFDSLSHKDYDIIISNPPYIEDGQISGLQPELQFEPRIALSAGADGLHLYRRIIRGAAGYLKNNGLLMMEIGFGQRNGLEKIFSDSGEFGIIEVVKDYNNIDRVVVARKADTKWIN